MHLNHLDPLLYGKTELFQDEDVYGSYLGVPFYFYGTGFS